MSIAVMSHTDRIQVDKVFRLKCRIENRVAYLSRYLDMFKSDHQRPAEMLCRVRFRKFEESCSVLLKRLDNNKLITNALYNSSDSQYLDILKQVNTWPKSSLDHFEEMYGTTSHNIYYVKDSKIQWFMDLLAESQNKMQLLSLSARLKMETKSAVTNQWHVVFSTLTVNSEYYDEVFKKGSDSWRNYIRSIKRQVAKELYGSYREAERQGEEYFHYFAVVEEGSKNGRLHLHCLMYLKTLPDQCKTDPNAGLYYPTNREVSGFKRYWPYGFSTHIAVRFGTNDAYARLGWSWPVDKVLKKPIQITESDRLVNYVVKYITKSHTNKLIGGISTWRTRITKNLGMSYLNNAINHLNQDQVKALVSMRQSPTKIEIMNTTVPYRLVRKVALRRYAQMMKQDQTLHKQPIKPKNLLLKKLLQNMTSDPQNYSERSFGDIVIEIMNVSVIYRDVYEHFKSAVDMIVDNKNTLSFITGGSPYVRY